MDRSSHILHFLILRIVKNISFASLEKISTSELVLKERCLINQETNVPKQRICPQIQNVDVGTVVQKTHPVGTVVIQIAPVPAKPYFNFFLSFFPCHNFPFLQLPDTF